MDGVNIILRQEGDKWSLPIPTNTDGMYIFEIIAEDDAGNETYFAKILFTISKSVIMSYLIPLDYQGELVELYSAHLLIEKFTPELDIFFTTHCLDRSYSAEVLSDL